MTIKQTHVIKWKLHDKLGVPHTEKMPVTWLRSLKKAKPGQTVINPTKIGKRSYRVPVVKDAFIKFKRELQFVFNFDKIKE